jgi:uncharacterized membrane protein
MGKRDGVFIFIGTYPDEATAKAAYETVRNLHTLESIGTYDAAVVTKDVNGKLHETKDELTTRHGAWGGVAVGAVIGVLFPPAIIGSAAIGAAVGALGSHIWKGVSRADVKVLGELIDAGEACLLVIGESNVEDALHTVGLRAQKQVAKQLDVDAKDIDEAIKYAAQQLGTA